MKTLWAFILGAVGLSVLLPAPLYRVTAQEATFTFEGFLVQGTPDGAPLPESLPLTLTILQADGGSAVAGTTTSREGLFTFENVPLQEEGAFYVVSTQWAGIEQFSAPMTYAEATSSPVDFPLYEVTDDLSTVIADRGNLRVEFQDVDTIGIQVLFELQYSNLGDRIVLANPGTPDAHSITFELPVGALGISPAQPPEGSAVQRYVDVSSVNGLPIPGVRDTQPLVPNWPNKMVVSFFVPYEFGAVLDMRFPISVAGLGVWVREDSVSVASEILELSEQRETLSGRRYALYEQTRPLERDEPFVFSLLGQPTQTVQTRENTSQRPASNDDTVTTALLVMILALIILFVGVLIWLMRRRASLS